MKKTLAAVAVLGAFAGSAVAADVTLYGLVDYSLKYQHLDADVANVDATDTTQMASGANSMSRFGLKARLTLPVTSLTVNRSSSLKAPSVALLSVVSDSSPALTAPMA